MRGFFERKSSILSFSFCFLVFGDELGVAKTCREGGTMMSRRRRKREKEENAPHALQSDLGPSGPCAFKDLVSETCKTVIQHQQIRTFRHSGESTVPQSRQTNSPSSTLIFFFFFSPVASPLTPFALIPIPRAP